MSIDDALAILNGEQKQQVRRAPQQREHELQVACIKWFRAQFAFPRALIFAVPNGAFCGFKQGNKLKAEGLVAGIPDLCVPIARGRYHSLYIEMKNGKKGRVSEEQHTIHEYLVRNGFCVAVCRDFDGFRKIVTEYFQEKL